MILSFSTEPDHVLVEKVRECQALGVDVSLVPRLYESINERATPRPRRRGAAADAAHRSIPRAGSSRSSTRSIAAPRCWRCIVLSPVLAAIAAAVKLTSPGPVLFRQQRVGRDGRDVRRAQVPHHDGGAACRRASSSATAWLRAASRAWTAARRIGRVLRDLSLDELPQLFNVLRGDMSLVGPRPERPEYVVRFARDVARYEDRHRVKSGITGWAQVHGYRGQTSIADRVEWDNYYIQNWSIWLDLRIIFMTIAEVLRFRG